MGDAPWTWRVSSRGSTREPRPAGRERPKSAPSHAGLYGDGSDYDESEEEFVARTTRRQSLGDSLQRLLEAIRAETDPQKVAGHGRILTTAAGLIGRETELAANYHVAQHLARLNAYEEASPFVERAETVYRSDEANKAKFPDRKSTRL